LGPIDKRTFAVLGAILGLMGLVGFGSCAGCLTICLAPESGPGRSDVAVLWVSNRSIAEEVAATALWTVLLPASLAASCGVAIWLWTRPGFALPGSHGRLFSICSAAALLFGGAALLYIAINGPPNSVAPQTLHALLLGWAALSLGVGAAILSMIIGRRQITR
jgi:hypothetical protein